MVRGWRVGLVAWDGCDGKLEIDVRQEILLNLVPYWYLMGEHNI